MKRYHLQLFVAVLGLGTMGYAGHTFWRAKQAEAAFLSLDSVSAVPESQEPTPAKAPVKKAAKPAKVKKPAIPPDPDLLFNVYLQTPDDERRSDMIYSMAESSHPEVRAILEKVFSTETSVDLKTDLLDAVESMEGDDALKLAVFQMAVSPTQPDDVRQAVMEILADFDAPAIAPLLEILRDTGSTAIHDSAVVRLKELEEMTTAAATAGQVSKQ